MNELTPLDGPRMIFDENDTSNHWSPDTSILSQGRGEPLRDINRLRCLHSPRAMRMVADSADSRYVEVSTGQKAHCDERLCPGFSYSCGAGL